MRTLRRMLLIPVGLLFLCLLVGSGLFCRNAFALVGDTGKAFGLDGSIRTLFFLLDQDGTYPFSGHNTLDAVSQTILRLTAAGKPTDSLAYEVHWVESTTAGTARLAGGSLLTFGNTNTGNVLRYRVLGADWNVVEKDRVLSNASFDRFNLKMSFPWGDIVTGRQAITFGKTFFWNPLDVFFPFGSNQFDRDYKPGIDALRVDIPFGRFSGFNLVGAVGPRIRLIPGQVGGNNPEDASWYGSALLGRLFANHWGWDFSLQGGKVFGGWQVGAGVVGDVGPVQVRGEATQFLAASSDPLPNPLKGDLVESATLLVAGLGHRFENTLSVDFEYFYNGAGDPGNLNAALVRTQYGSSLQLSRHLAGLSLSYDFTPIIVGRLAVISSLSDGSTELQPSVTFSLSNEMELLAGLILNFGPAPEQSTGKIQSEFGTIPDIFFLEWKYYF